VNVLKIIGVVGSPNENGNTATIVKEILQSAEGEGADVSLNVLGKISINPCTACLGCEKTGYCIQDDDMSGLYTELVGADVLVLGSPIYFDHVTSQTKMFIDRLYPNCFQSNISIKKAVVILTYEWDDPEVYDSVIDWIKGRLQTYHKMETVAVMKAYDTIENPVSNQKIVLEEAREVGKGLV